MANFIIILMLFSCAAAYAQQPLNPATLGTGSLTAEGAQARSNTMGFGVTANGAFDDNATNPTNVVQALSNSRFSLQPQLSLDVNRSRLSTSLFYAPGYTYSSDIDAYNSNSQAAGMVFQYQLAKRLSLHFVGAFSLTTNPYDSFQASTELPSIGILSRPNASVVGTDIRNRTEQSQLDFTYQLGRHTSIGIGGNVADLNYRTPTLSGSAALQHSRAWIGNAFYSHQLSPRYSFGVRYSAQTSNSEAPGGLFSLLSHQAVGFLDVTLNPKVSFAIFAGPEFSKLDNSYSATNFSSHSDQQSFVGGATLTVHGKRNGLSASFLQQVSDSGLNGAGSLLVRSTQLELERKIKSRFAVHFFGNYISNNQLDFRNPVSLTDVASAGVTFTRLISQHLNLSVSGMRQQVLGTPGQTLSQFGQHSHDVASVSLSYNLLRPIGR